MTESITNRLATPDDAEIIYQQRLAMFEDIWGPLDPDGVATMESTFIPWVCRGLADGSYRGWLACDDDGRVIAGGGLIVHEWMHASPFGRPLYESLGFEPTNEMRLHLEK